MLEVEETCSGHAMRKSIHELSHSSSAIPISVLPPPVAFGTKSRGFWGRLFGWLLRPSSQLLPAANSKGVHGTKWDELQFMRCLETRDEAQRVGGILNTKPSLGDETSKSRILEVQGPRILHLATRAYFLQHNQSAAVDMAESVGSKNLENQPTAPWENPLLRAGIALAGANQKSSALLTARDVTSLDLKSTDVTVLSGCDTNGELPGKWSAVAALQQAFLQSGSTSVVMSLWDVTTAQRQEFLEDYYANTQSGKSSTDALPRSAAEVEAAGRRHSALGRLGVRGIDECCDAMCENRL